MCRLTTYSKTRVRVSLVWMMSWRSTMLACFRPFRRDAADTQQGHSQSTAPGLKRMETDWENTGWISCCRFSRSFVNMFVMKHIVKKWSEETSSWEDDQLAYGFISRAYRVLVRRQGVMISTHTVSEVKRLFWAAGRTVQITQRYSVHGGCWFSV